MIALSAASDSIATCAQSDVFSSGGGERCGVRQRGPGREKWAEIPIKDLVGDESARIGGKLYKCNSGVSAGNCRDGGTAICWDPVEIKPLLKTGIEQKEYIPGTEPPSLGSDRTNYYDNPPVMVPGGVTGNGGGKPPLNGSASSDPQPTFQVSLPIKGQKPIIITFRSPYSLNWAQSIYPPSGSKTFRSALGEPVRLSDGKLWLKITDVVLQNGSKLKGPYYKPIPSNVRLP